MPPDQQQYQKIFLAFMEEAGEHLEIMEQGLKRLPAVMANPDREEAIAIYRAAHTIKGGAAMLMNQSPSLTSINKVAKSLEDCFKPIKDAPFKVDATAQTLANKAYEVLKNLISRCQSPGGLSPQVGEKIVTASAPLFEKLEAHLQALASGKAAPATPAAQPTATTPGVPKAAAQVMTVLKPMLQGFKQAESAASRKQIAALCGRLTKVGPAVAPWQTLVKTAYQAIGNPSNSYADLASTVIKELKQGSEFLEAGKANEIAPSPALLQLVSGAAKPAAVAQQITIPADPKEVVKVLLKTFDKKQLQAIAQLLIKHIKT
ncbi:MAG: Hpt domain-containing protein [Limnoraphis robusta]|uniref:Hpt domain-containing protein n=1 Tax=Limnoraphis robusta CCNP1315 TaxID=3110306 RepID=A0ABU5U1U3_9CYAN|nr:Hpt domain-containing protein [Limnoraphis robusta]MEA5500906.1 Hpt domain-containing protein [Limnoraphis robusta BA-68 BA1]MEA5521169.1 Hpt domain-containing protein [Limnoraphis robusta CCNP1315]MEA5537950.1 Hpt domain-containing protein [Limnoraphis robusta Tam1]MEA5546681.1 Hpt domain-containing protein [Limnoraphis robusta CCNP1324]